MRGRSFDETPEYRYLVIRFNDLSTEKQLEIEGLMRGEIIEHLEHDHMLPYDKDGKVIPEDAEMLIHEIIEPMKNRFWAEIEVDVSTR